MFPWDKKASSTQVISRSLVLVLFFGRLRVPTRRCDLVVPADGGWGRSNEEDIIVVAVDDDGDVEDTDDKDVDNEGDALSSSSILFSKMKFHINGSAILPNDCVLIPIPFNRGGVVINRPSWPICSSILLGDRSVLFPILTT